MKAGKLIAVSFIPLLLVGCSPNANSGTPNFSNEQNVENSQNDPQGEKGTREDSSNKESPDSVKKQENEKSESGTSKKPPNNTLGYKLTEEDKKKGVKLNDSGIPYVDSVNGGGVAKDGEKVDGDTTKSESKNADGIYAPSNDNVSKAISVANSYIDSVKSKKWDKACENVWLDEITKAECVTYLKDIYGSGNDFVKYDSSKTGAIMKSKNYMTINLKDRTYENDQRLSFIMDNGQMKIFLK